MATAQERIDILLKFNADRKAILDSRNDLAQLRESFAGVASLGKNLLGGIGIGFGLSSVINQFKSLTDQAAALSSEIERSRSRLGLTAESYQVFTTVLKGAGQGIDVLNPAFDKLADIIGNAGRGAADAVKSLDAIGLKFRDLRGLTPEEQFQKVSEALARIKDDNLRAAAGVDILGKSYSQLKPLIDAIAEKGMPQLKEETRRTSGLMSNELSRALDEAGNRSENAGQRIAKSFGEVSLRIKQATASAKEFAANIVDPQNNQQTPDQQKASDVQIASASVSSVGGGGTVEAFIIAQRQRLREEKAREGANDFNAAREETARDKEIAQQRKDAAEEIKRIEDSAAAERAERNARYSRELRVKMEQENADLMKRLNKGASDAAKFADGRVSDNNSNELAARNQQRQQQDIALAEQLAAKQLEIARIEQNRFLTNTQKQAAITPLLKEENDLIARRIALLKEQATLEPDAGARIQIAKNIEGLQKDQGQVSLQQEQNQPLGFGAGIQQGAVDYVNSVGTAGEQVAQVINGTIGGAVASVSDGLSDWVLGAKSFGDAMQQVGAEILSTVVHEFVNAMVAGFARMVVQWIITKSAMFAIDVAFAAKGLALSIATAAKSLISWIPSAIAASISSYGLAAGIGAAAVAAILVARNNFAQGGLVTGPGTGTSDSIPANLSNGEYVLPAAVVQRIGLANVRAMHYGRQFAQGGLVSAPAAAAAIGAPASPSIIVNFGEEAVRDHVFGHSDFDAHVIRVLNDRGYRSA